MAKHKKRKKQPESPYQSLSKSFEDSIARYVVLIESHDDKNGGWGSGVIIGINDEGAALIVTARHVVDGYSGSDVTWKISRGFARDEIIRTVEFTSKANLDTGRNDAGFLIPRDVRYDVAQILVPAECIDGRVFMDKEDVTPSVLEPGFWAKPGATIAWAGFPNVAYNCVKRPVLCLYQGIVSATITTDTEPPIYLVDGHISPGVSGGPVWSPEQKGPLLAGLVSSYWGDDYMPGLCHVVPLNPLGYYIQDQIRSDE